MTRPDAAALLPLAESIADGSPVDWDEAEARATGDEQAIIRQLRILANLAVLHRSLPDPAESTDAAASRRAHSAPAIGSWAHLALVERLGGGTFGDVYKAWDRHLEREVALKLLRVEESLDDDPQSSRIAREGRLLARIRHQNVITVHGVAVHEQRVGLWMELVRGATLEQILQKRGPFSAREASLVGIDLCRALAAIHAAGLIHRDVKAQNVMREEGGRIVLMDLGTSREIDPDGGHPLSDLAGTPLYLAPEIFGGAPASERSDLFSLGVLLYHLVTGAFPARATTIEELRAVHAKGTAVRLRDARADLPTAFVQVVDRAIASDPDRRYASAGALEADLVSALDDVAQVPVAGPAPQVAAAAHEQTRAQVWSSRRHGVIAMAMAAALVLAVAGWPALRSWFGPRPIHSIVVLPMVNLSGDPSQEYFADGMTEELIGMLGQLSGLNVISRTSAMQFKGSKKPLPEIARALGVDAVLEASVLTLPDNTAGHTKRVRINARLIRAGTDTLIWDQRFEHVADNVFALQREVAQAVADGISLRRPSWQALSPVRPSAERESARQFDTFDVYLKGRYFWNMRKEEGLRRSVQYFQEAIDRDPRYALAYAGLADAYHLLGEYGVIPRAQALGDASAAASKALELDESVAEAHASLGFIHADRFEWDAAETSYKRALALKPGYATAHHWYAYELVQRGHSAEAIEEIKKAVKIDPLSVGVNGAFGAILTLSRQYDEAIAQLERTVAMDPAFARNHIELARAYALKGVSARALEEADKAAALGVRDVADRAETGYVMAIAGRRSEALAIVRELVDRYRRHEDGAATGVATVYAGLGVRDQTLDWLEKAWEARDHELGGMKVDPRFDFVRRDARFGKLLATVGLAQ